MTAISGNTIYLDSKWLDENHNKKSQGSLVDRIVTYLKRGSGARKVLKIVQKLSRIIHENGVHSEKLKKLDEGIGLTGSALGITRLPHTLNTACKSLASLNQKEDGINFTRKVIESVRDTTDLISGAGYAVAFVANNTAAGTVGQVSGLVSDATGFHLIVSDLGKAVTLEKEAQGKIKAVLTHTKKYYMLCVAQSVIGLATGILALVMLATGVSFIPSLAWISISLAMITFSVGLSFFKNKGPYKIVTFDKNVKLMA